MKYITLLLYTLLTAYTLYATDHTVATVEEAVALLNTIPAGDRVLLQDGVYRDAAIRFHNENGTAASPVVFAAVHPGQVRFEGNSTLGFSGRYIIVDGFVWQQGGKDLGGQSVVEFKNGHRQATHCTVRHCVIDSYNNSDLNSDNKWVSLFGAYNTVSHCLLKNKQNRGATLTVWLNNGEAAHHTICYNYFLNRQNGPNADNGLESIRVGDSKTSMTSAHCVVAFNRFEDCDGEIEIISNKSCHNTYLHNTFYNCDGGLTLRHGNDCLCDGNFFNGGSKKLSYGIRIIGEGHVVINNYFYRLLGSMEQVFRAPVVMVNGIPGSPQSGYFQVKRAVVANNTFVNCLAPDIRIGAHTRKEATLPPDSVRITNNLFYDDAGTGGMVYEEKDKPLHTIWEGNKISAPYLKVNVEGIERLKGKLVRSEKQGITNDKGDAIIPHLKKEQLPGATTAGADWIEEAIAAAATTYNVLSTREVGPQWMGQ